MFLRSLNKQQKELVLGLIVLAAKSNGVIEEREKQCIYMFADEMGIDVSEASLLQFKTICEEIKKESTCKEINHIVFEIAGLMLSDFDYDDDEKKFMDQLIEEFDISKEKLGKMIEYLNEYFALMKKINILMFD